MSEPSDPSVFTPPPPLESTGPVFWRLSPEAAAALKPQAPLSITHGKTLADLGPSPFPKGGFPLIGFLASVYEKVSRYAESRIPQTSPGDTGGPASTLAGARTPNPRS